MAGETALSNVRKYDFFAILGSGSYVVGCYWLLINTWLARNKHHSTQDALSWLNGNFEGHWPSAVAFLFLAFLVGNVLRALPVNLLDEFWKNSPFEKLRKRFGKADKTNSLYETKLRSGKFPYPEMIKGELSALEKSMLKGEPSLLKDIQKTLEFDDSANEAEEGKNTTCIKFTETWHSAYNFWKAELCSESVATFEYIQELEGRVRLFSTMIGASFLGFLAGVIGLPLSLISLPSLGWLAVMLLVLFLSATIFLVFGSYLRRVRGQEVAGVFLAYVSLSLKRSRAKGSSSI